MLCNWGAGWAELRAKKLAGRDGFNSIRIRLKFGLIAPTSERRLITRSFVEACCDRISERLVESVKRSEKVRTSNGRELVVIKDAAIKAYMKEHDIHLQSCCMRSSSNVDSAARAASRAAGDRALFGRPVSGAAGVLR